MTTSLQLNQHDRKIKQGNGEWPTQVHPVFHHTLTINLDLSREERSPPWDKPYLRSTPTRRTYHHAIQHVTPAQPGEYPHQPDFGIADNRCNVPPVDVV